MLGVEKNDKGWSYPFLVLQRGIPLSRIDIGNLCLCKIFI